jgi:hypothetical protein
LKILNVPDWCAIEAHELSRRNASVPKASLDITKYQDQITLKSRLNEPIGINVLPVSGHHILISFRFFTNQFEALVASTSVSLDDVQIPQIYSIFRSLFPHIERDATLSIRPHQETTTVAVIPFLVLIATFVPSNGKDSKVNVDDAVKSNI